MGLNMFLKDLEKAIDNERMSNFKDEVYGIPIKFDFDEDNKTIDILVKVNECFQSKYGEQTTVEIDLKKYSEVSLSNSVRGEKTQEYYFTVDSKDYFVVILGC